MPTADLLALRPGAPDEATGATVPPLGPAPSPATRRNEELRLRRWSRGAFGATAASLVHAALVVMFLSIWHGMVRAVEAPEPISVEIVHAVPGEDKKPEPTPPPPPAAAAAPAPTPPPSPPAPKPPPASALEEALKSPLMEPPPEPKAAAAQSAHNQTGAAGDEPLPEPDTPRGSKTDAPAKPDADAKPPAVPQVLTAEKGDTAVPAPSHETDPSTVPVPGDPTGSARTATAKLAAALATESIPMPLSFRAALSARGTSDDANYRGSVFGAIIRAKAAVAEEAEARHLQGQVVMAIVLTDTGEIASVSVVQSSGSAEADAFAVRMIRQAAPFPPPPAGASHTFTPAIAFGAE